MVMITLPQPAHGYLILDDQGRPLGRVDRPREPDLLRSDTVLLQRSMPKLEPRLIS
jgi:hypothetical protein